MAIQKPPFGSDAAKRAILSSKTFGMTPPLVAGLFVEQRVGCSQCVGEVAGEVGVETVRCAGSLLAKHSVHRLEAAAGTPAIAGG